MVILLYLFIIAAKMEFFKNILSRFQDKNTKQDYGRSCSNNPSPSTNEIPNEVMDLVTSHDLLDANSNNNNKGTQDSYTEQNIDFNYFNTDPNITLDDSQPIDGIDCPVLKVDSTEAEPAYPAYPVMNLDEFYDFVKDLDDNGEDGSVTKSVPVKEVSDTVHYDDTMNLDNIFTELIDLNNEENTTGAEQFDQSVFKAVTKETFDFDDKVALNESYPQVPFYGFDSLDYDKRIEQFTIRANQTDSNNNDCNIKELQEINVKEYLCCTQSCAKTQDLITGTVNKYDMDSSLEDSMPLSKLRNLKSSDSKSPKDLEKSELESDYCCGYHSSDFEFISESEAEADGLYNMSSRCYKPKKKTKTSDCNEKPQRAMNMTTGLPICDPEHSKESKADSLKKRDYKSMRQKFLAEETERLRQNHIIPQGQDFLDLFDGPNAAIANDLYILENKSTRAQLHMNVQYEGIGFDMRVVNREERVNENDKKSADETAKKIQDMYPVQNRKRRRRT